MAETTTDCVNVTDTLTSTPTTNTVIKIIALGMIDLAVVLGNSLVVAAVLTTRKLRTVTNIFIVSLACADLLLGFAVLPFSISIEVVDVWLWGTIWCSMWLAIDVWLCTASILSLCAISLDRFVAVTHPIRYPSIMSPFRGRVLVSLVWILSFVICLPPLLGWNDGETDTAASKFMDSFHNRSTSNLDKLLDTPRGESEDFLWNLTAAVNYYDGLLSNMSLFMNKSDTCNVDGFSCELTPTKGYRIYAAMGSFFIPALVMVFFYFRIYLTAVRTAASLRKGVLTTRASSDLPNHTGYGEEEIHLRVHRGGGSSIRYSSNRSYEWNQAVKKDHPRSPGLADSRSLFNSSNNHELNGRAHLIIKDDKHNKNNNVKCVKWSHNIFKPFAKQFRRSNNKSYRHSSEEDSTEMEVLNSEGKCNSLSKPVSIRSETDSPNLSPAHSLKRSPRRCKLLIKEGKATSSIKGHARKFKREAKAAKTLAIIVGAFIVCWCPFFTIYLLGAFCQDCVSEIVFAVFFWLGYCNSALNPCIYALFARDFRFAFKRLLFCKRRKGFTQASREIYITGTRNRLTPPTHDNDSTSDY